MICALFTLFATAWGYGNNLCFDLEKDGRDDSSQAADDDWNEATNCRVEARAKACSGEWVYRYSNGVGNMQESSDDDPGCIGFDTPIHLYPVEVQMTCSDAMWIDKFYLHRYDSSGDCGGKKDDTYVWGINNHKGWCMSTDTNDAAYFKGKGMEVPANKCYQAFQLNGNHNVMARTGGGFFTYPQGRRLEEDVSGALVDVSEMTVAQEAEVALKAQPESDITARLGGERRRQQGPLCRCDTPGEGTAGKNKIVCDNDLQTQPDRYCAANEYCFLEKNKSVVYGDWDKLCKPEMCSCDSPGIHGNPIGKNKINCDFGHRYCAPDENCTSDEQIVWGDWGQICKRALKLNR